MVRISWPEHPHNFFLKKSNSVVQPDKASCTRFPFSLSGNFLKSKTSPFFYLSSSRLPIPDLRQLARPT